jgi:5-formyltetrahydrofolate cyclo-ligase
MPNQFTHALRNSIKQVRSKISEAYQKTSSHQICHHVSMLDQYKKAKHLALYSAINREIDLNNLWNSAPLQEKLCYFPVLNKDYTLSFLPATPHTPFQINQFGILEPEVSLDKAIPIEELDIIILPLVAFDFRCTRLGMGAGYYDRTLKNKIKASLFGVGYQFQRVDFINPQPWDVPMDAVITQKAIYRRHSW